jgi:short-subunit dehydrogenase
MIGASGSLRRFLSRSAAVGIGAVAAAHLYRISRETGLAGRRVFITGGSRGLGFALAQVFAEEGCPIALCARGPEGLERARKHLESRGAVAFSYICDVADREQVERVISDAERELGRIDILVNNAGVIQVGPAEDMTLADYESAMNIMYWGTVYPTLQVLPSMLERGAGHIVNIASIGGRVSVPHLVPYCAAKFAVVGFSEGLGAELKQRGVRVLTIAPGLMRTGSYVNALFKGHQQLESVWFGIGASTPGLTISANRAARQIVKAVKQNRAQRTLSTQANLLAMFHGLFPGLTVELMSWANRLMPPPSGQPELQRGKEIYEGMNSRILDFATAMGRKAGERYNQPIAGSNT